MNIVTTLSRLVLIIIEHTLSRSHTILLHIFVKIWALAIVDFRTEPRSWQMRLEVVPHDRSQTLGVPFPYSSYYYLYPDNNMLVRDFIVFCFKAHDSVPPDFGGFDVVVSYAFCC